jgi:hypothetical protein
MPVSTNDLKVPGTNQQSEISNQKSSNQPTYLNIMQNLLKDLRLRIRGLVKHPGFTLVAIITLGLGIGVNTAILSTVNGFILRPINVPRASEVVMPFWGSKKEAEVWGSFSYANYVDLRDQNKSFADCLPGTWCKPESGETASRDAGGGRQAELAWGETVSNNYFSVLELTTISSVVDSCRKMTARRVLLRLLSWVTSFGSAASIPTLQSLGRRFT